MHYAIIAAGEGSRLTAEGITSPKPLVQLGEESLIDRLVRIFANNHATAIYVISHTRSATLTRHLEQLSVQTMRRYDIPLQYVLADTMSSMHSLAVLVENTPCGSEPFCLTTVDTVFNETVFPQFIHTFIDGLEHHQCEGLMGTTTLIDDEKPLYVETDEQGNILGFIDHSTSCITISAGVYALTNKAVPILHKCIAAGQSRMRNFQRALIENGLQLKAFDMGKVIDIDHREDIEKAKLLLMEQHDIA